MLRCFSNHLKKEKTKRIFAWAETQVAKPPHEQVDKISLLRKRDLSIPTCLHTISPASHKLQGPLCPKGHHAQAPETHPTTQPQCCSSPKASSVGRGGGEMQSTHPTQAPTTGEGSAPRPALCTDESTRPQGCPSQNRGSQPRRPETKQLHLLFCFLPSHPAYLYCYM